MRIRQIKPSFWLNEDLAKLSHLARLTWVGLWAIADRAGRMEARPQRIRGQLFPYEPSIQIDAILSELQAGGFLVRYENDGAWYFEIPNFTKHQRFSGQEAKNDSTLPGPKESGSVSASKEEAKPASKEEASNVRSSDIRSTENGVRNQSSRSQEDPTSGNETQTALVLAIQSDDPTVLRLPCEGPVPIWDLTRSQIARWQELYPSLDVEAECRSALAWVEASPERRKTAKGAPRFLQGWLGRAKDRAPQRGVQGPSLSYREQERERAYEQVDQIVAYEKALLAADRERIERENDERKLRRIGGNT